jgi:hypothetical protein
MMTIVAVSSILAVPAYASREFFVEGSCSGGPGGGEAMFRNQIIQAGYWLEIDINISSGRFNFYVITEADFQKYGINETYDNSLVEAHGLTNDTILYGRVSQTGLYVFTINDYGSGEWGSASYQVWLWDEIPPSQVHPVAPEVLLIGFSILGAFVAAIIVIGVRSSRAKKSTGALTK